LLRAGRIKHQRETRSAGAYRDLLPVLDKIPKRFGGQPYALDKTLPQIFLKLKAPDLFFLTALC